MALDALEWGIILVMGAGILIWGPDKIPDIAKTLARARKEFDGATKQLQGITKELQTGINAGNLNLDTISNAIIGAGTASGISGNPTPEEIARASAGSTPVSVTPSGVAQAPATVAATAPTPVAPKKSADQMLIDMARSLKISTTGMTREEISKAIMDVVATKPVGTAPAAAPPAEAAAAEAAPVETPPAAGGEGQTQATETQGEPQAQPAAQD